ncbi:hypothetical protein GCM10010415_20120 [Streptomyces atrovirens]
MGGLAQWVGSTPHERGWTECVAQPAAGAPSLPAQAGSFCPLLPASFGLGEWAWVKDGRVLGKAASGSLDPVRFVQIRSVV